MKLLFIINLHSGKGLIRNSLAHIIDRFNKAGYLVTVCTTQNQKHATDIAAQYGGQYDLIVCSGGDGTLSEVLDGLMRFPEDKRPNIGYIPAGSTNDYASSIGLPSSMTACGDLIAEGNFYPVDVGLFNGSDYFVYVCAFGAFTEVSWNTPQKEKNALGHNAYILEGIKQFSGLKSYHVRMEIDGEELVTDCIYAMVYNALSVGGFKNLGGKEVKLDDGKLNMMVINTPANPVEFSILVADLITHNPNSNYIMTYEVEKVHVESETPIEWVLDGEYGGAHTSVDISVVPSAMNIAMRKDLTDNKKISRK